LQNTLPISMKIFYTTPKPNTAAPTGMCCLGIWCYWKINAHSCLDLF